LILHAGHIFRHSFHYAIDTPLMPLRRWFSPYFAADADIISCHYLLLPPFRAFRLADARFSPIIDISMITPYAADAI
jgi:hypothetical protein